MGRSTPQTGHNTWSRSWAALRSRNISLARSADTVPELKAYIAIFELLGREDRIELKKAQRVVEKRRGDLLDPSVTQGQRTDLETFHHDGKFDVHRSTATNYRRLAVAWSVLEPHLLEATDIEQVSRRALLALCRLAPETGTTPSPKPEGSGRLAAFGSIVRANRFAISPPE